MDRVPDRQMYLETSSLIDAKLAKLFVRKNSDDGSTDRFRAEVKRAKKAKEKAGHRGAHRKKRGNATKVRKRIEGPKK